MIKKFSKGIVKDIVIVAIGVIAIWVGLQAAFGTANPFYVVSSGSMVPVLQVYDVLVVNGHESFSNVKVGDIIVFDRPAGHDRVIVHRVASIIEDGPNKTIRTKGDANPASIPGTDFPITDDEYIGKVAYVIPQIGFVTQILRPPINYILIGIVIAVMVIKQVIRKKNEKELQFSDPVYSEKQNKKISELDLHPKEDFQEKSDSSKNSSNVNSEEGKSNP